MPQQHLDAATGEHLDADQLAAWPALEYFRLCCETERRPDNAQSA
jgi:hypothetical protein